MEECGVFYKYIELAEIRLKEIRKGLKDFECLELEGMWFILDQDYEMKVLSYTLR